MLSEPTPDEIISQSVALLNEYRLYIDVDLIFDSEDDFPDRREGQLKVDNSVVEEFLASPHSTRRNP